MGAPAAVSHSSDEVDVGIVGAGPVGLLLALLLHKKGVRVAVYERQPTRYPLPRAATMDHESQRILHAAGLGKELSGMMENVCTVPGKTFCWRDADGGLLVDLCWERPSMSGFPRVSAFTQPQLEGFLEDTALDAGILIRRGLELKSYTQTSDRVVAQFDGFPAKEEAVVRHTLEAKYLCGCDGANSAVRTLADITFFDLQFDSEWLVCDLIPLNGFVPECVQELGNWQSCDPSRPTTVVFGGPGKRRLEFMKMPHETKEDLVKPGHAWTLAKKWGYTPENSILERLAVYTFRSRWAETWNSGRILLAGDAAHQMPPFIGQGLNSGFRDVAALAWRLPLILQAGAHPSLLESYTTERLKHVQSLTNHCIHLGKVICMLDPKEAERLHEDMRTNPPPDGFDPPLGRPGISTSQKFAGKIGLQREVIGRSGAKPALLDEVYGVGWHLITASAASADDMLPPPVLQEFQQRLGGKVIALDAHTDVTGEYHTWLRDTIGQEVVLVRPDFYVQGGSSLAGAAALVEVAMGQVFG